MIDVEGLVETYSDGTKAVDDITFEVKEGEFFGFLGPNGAQEHYHQGAHDPPEKDQGKGLGGGL